MKKTIQSLRELMKKHEIQAYLIPSSDPHQNEYVPKFWQRRKFISGFTGSAGDVVVTTTEAGLWTDSRYFLQAEKQLDSSIFKLFKMGLPDVLDFRAWLSKKLKPGEALGVDPKVISHKEFVNLKEELGKKGISLKCIKENLVDSVWEQRPEPPKGEIEVHEEQYAGESVTSKLNRVRKKMAEEGADAHIVSMLDSIAWLFNIRGSDVEYNPVAISYAIVTKKEATFFIDLDKLTKRAIVSLKESIEIRPYIEFESELNSLRENKSTVWIDETTISQWIVEVLENGAKLILKPSPVTLFKAIKNKIEIQGIKNAHLRDGVAMVKFFYWLDQALKKTEVTELSAAKKAEEFRSEGELFKGLSFESISSYGKHGAIIHYAVSPETDIPLKQEGIYLIDSGGQYYDGTTDITRTITLGNPTEKQKDHFTRVLKGLIDLSLTSFPQGTVGKQLDTIAREALWKIGLNYMHGTGHGVGSFLNVHEGPQAISYYRCIGIGLEPGMITTIEPGYYKENEHGMRVENIVVVVNDEERSSEDFTFYKFETLTLCPIDLRLANKEIMTEEEIKWLNDYHQKVYDKLSPLLDKPELDWLKEVTIGI